MDNLNTLVLRKDYQPFSLFPISFIKAKDAVTRVVSGSCEVVANYDRRILTANPNTVMYWPSVVRSLDPKYKKFREVPNLEPESLYYRDHAICQYCGKELTIKEVTKDHVIPACRGGRTTWDNIVAACGNCNTRKGNQLPVGQWKPRRMPYTPTTYELVKIRKKYPLIIPDESWRPWLGEWQGEIKIREVE